MENLIAFSKGEDCHLEVDPSQLGEKLQIRQDQKILTRGDARNPDQNTIKKSRHSDAWERSNSRSESNGKSRHIKAF